MLNSVKCLDVVHETNVQCFLHFQTSFHHYSQLTYCIPCSSPSSESILTVTQLLFDDWCNSVVDKIQHNFGSVTYPTNGSAVLTS